MHAFLYRKRNVRRKVLQNDDDDSNDIQTTQVRKHDVHVSGL